MKCWCNYRNYLTTCLNRYWKWPPMLSQCFSFLIREFLSCWKSQLAFTTNCCLAKTLCLIVFMLFSLITRPPITLIKTNALFMVDLTSTLLFDFFFAKLLSFFNITIDHLLWKHLQYVYICKSKLHFFSSIQFKIVDKKYYLHFYSILFHKFLFHLQKFLL